MKKAEIKKRIENLLKDPNYEFRFQMAGVYVGTPTIKCDICEDMVDSTVQTAYHKTIYGKSIGICLSCNQYIIEKWQQKTTQN